MMEEIVKIYVPLSDYMAKKKTVYISVECFNYYLDLKVF